MQSVLTENTDLLETKLVDILDEFQLPDDKTLSIVKEEEENSLILVTATTNESKHQQPVPRRKGRLAEFPDSEYSDYSDFYYYESDYSDSDSDYSQLSNQKKLPNWAVSPYDLGGHSPYFSSQKIFSSSSSFYFLVFSR